MRKRFTNHSRPRSSRSVVARVGVFGLILLWVLASLLVHPLPHDVSDRASAPLLSGADTVPSVTSVFSHACMNCHSEKTHWPWYSQVAPASWFVESDVKRAR